MKEILGIIENEKQTLSEHDLFKWMSSSNDPLAFAPAMTFFVLGFRDVLSYVKRNKPETFWDHSINIHCEEDAHHWLWFIEDLQKLDLNKSEWGRDFSELLKKTWSENSYASRDMVYTLIHYAKLNRDPFVTLALIESLEAAFAVFINTLLPQIQKNGWENKLRYFGSRHHEDESGHSLGTWVGEGSVDADLENVILNDNQKMIAKALIKEIFERFDSVFSSWYEQRSNFSLSYSNLNRPEVTTYLQADLSN